MINCAAGATLRTAKPRRSAEGARLDGFLAESEGPIRDPDLSHFATVSVFSSAKWVRRPSRSSSNLSVDDDGVCPRLVFFLRIRFWTNKMEF